MKNLKKKLFLNNFIYLFFIMGALFLSLLYGAINNASLANKVDYFHPLEVWQSIVLPIIIFIFFIIGIALAIKNKIIVINKKFIVSTFILFLMIIYMVFLTLYKDNSHLINLKNEGYLEVLSSDRIKSIIDVTLVFLIIFSLFNLYPNFSKYKHLALYIFSVAFLLFTLYTIIYSLATEIEDYKYLLNNLNIYISKDWDINCKIKSIYAYSNSFSHFCLFAMLDIMVLSFVFKKKWIFLFTFIILPFVFAGSSRTAVLVALTMYILYWFYFVFTFLKDNKAVFFALLGFTLAIVIYFLLEVFLLKTISFTTSKGEILYIQDIFEMVYDILINNRMEIFVEVFKNYNVLDYIFGQGYGISMYSVRSYYLAYNYHNSFIEIYCAGGILLCLFYLLIVGYLYYLAIKTWIKGNKNSLIMLLIMSFMYIQYSLSESLPLFFDYCGGWVFSLMLTIPIIDNYNESIGNQKDIQTLNLFSKA